MNICICRKFESHHIISDLFDNRIKSPLVRLETRQLLDFLFPFEDGTFRNAVNLRQLEGGET